MVYVTKKTVDVSIRIEIVPIFDFQINVHLHVEEKNQQFGVTFFAVYFKEVIQMTTSNTLHCFLLTPISCQYGEIVWSTRGANGVSLFFYSLRSSCVVIS